MLLTCYITCIIITQGYYGTSRGDFSNFKILILTKQLTNSATFVWLDEVKCIHSWPSWKMAAILDFRLTNLDLITIEMAHANVGACIIICTIHPKNANYLLHSKSVKTCPDGNVTTCPNVISLTKFVIVKKNRCTLHLATYIQGSVYSRNHEHLYIHNI